MKTLLCANKNFFKKILLVTSIVVLSNALKLYAQSTSSGGGGNNYAASKFLGWGATSGDLPFKTNGITRLTLQNTTGFFGIGTPTPASLFVVGAGSEFQVDASGNLIKINGITYSFPIAQGSPRTVLINKGNGNLSWGVVGWSLLGNAWTDSTNFIGTTDNVPLNFRVNNLKAGRIDPAGPVFFGSEAGNSNSAANNTGFGYHALFSNTSGNGNTAGGYQALSSNTIGISNTANGQDALRVNIKGNYNTASGIRALSGSTGNNNTAYGAYALNSNNSGSNNTALGYGADVSANNLINATAIGYNAKVSASNSLVLGGMGSDSVNVGIGTTAPTAKLEVNGSVKITDGNQRSGRVLTSDANGNASWAPPVFPPGNRPGEMYYWDGSAWLAISPGTHAQTLTMCNGIPRWGPCTPIVTTASAIPSCKYETGNTATSGGNITNDGGSPITVRGVCWSTNPNPDTTNSKTSSGTGSGVFISTLTGLTVTTTYHARAYAANSAGIAYGNDVSFTVPIAIGYTYQGGVIAYLFQSGDLGYVAGQVHGLIAEPLDPTTRYSISLPWGCYERFAGATRTAIGTGDQNTADILSHCTESGTAARYCHDLATGGFHDWYLPSKDELYVLSLNAIAIGSVDYRLSDYWSSSEIDNYSVWEQVYVTGAQTPDYKQKLDQGSWDYVEHRVRAIRKF